MWQESRNQCTCKTMSKYDPIVSDISGKVESDEICRSILKRMLNIHFTTKSQWSNRIMQGHIEINRTERERCIFEWLDGSAGRQWRSIFVEQIGCFLSGSTARWLINGVKTMNIDGTIPNSLSGDHESKSDSEKLRSCGMLFQNQGRLSGSADKTPTSI